MRKKIQQTKRRIASILYFSLFISLFSSEFINSMYNNRFDDLQMTFSERIIISFKPSVVGLYIIFTTILMTLIFRYLSPLFRFHTEKYSSRKERGKAYILARKAAIGVPRMIILFQMGVWFIGTTIYYAMKGWQADSGIPYLFGLMLKISSGILGALYVVFFINLLLIPIKRELKIIDIRDGEKDLFARYKDYIAIMVSSFYLIVQMTYLGWYFSQSTDILSMNQYVAPVFFVGLFLFIMSLGPNFLSRIEFHLQINEILSEMKNIRTDKSGEDHAELIYLTTFDELGELAAITNRVMTRFSNILGKVNDAVKHLSISSADLLENSQADAGATNDQAAAVAEVVATMEDSNRLSRQMGELALTVKNHSENNLDKVSQGIQTLKQYLNTMAQLKDSNNRAIDFVYSLNENIKTIIDVSAIIKSIADQVKIIAFNAELEAAAAGEAGKNFEIVASEVRRLADNTVNAATEIREKINYIEKESTMLHKASLETTELIDSGWNLSRETEASFGIIQDTSTTTSQSAHSISENIQIQILGFEQILLTMKEISSSSQNVSMRIKTTAGTATSLEELIQVLNELAG
ncbi:methyl-accepting chemotaxis protein [Oceanispirochaeta sp.]|jgi:methyl-accepting chemotaxis protein|uniref:methyl-accepting chemotaxis protein n=1 Tax=Oceanispirochaeta sp. TaxID=2035350 RepID=UPI00260BFF4E|nr:methyl-accepting chemotaxis protein [Oceanispirochaeta sp.]MDA3958946.1 methyl-accepting chemotaxis protein [Oceanispirochaeta sp.]